MIIVIIIFSPEIPVRRYTWQRKWKKVCKQRDRRTVAHGYQRKRENNKSKSFKRNKFLSPQTVRAEVSKRFFKATNKSALADTDDKKAHMRREHDSVSGWEHVCRALTALSPTLKKA